MLVDDLAGKPLRCNRTTRTYAIDGRPGVKRGQILVSAGGYILQVPKDRRKLLLDEAEHGGSFYRSKPYISEPVPRFDHSRRAPLSAEEIGKLI